MHVLIGTGVFALCQLLNIMVLAKLGGADEVGKFSLGLAISAPIMLFFNFGLRTLLVTDAKHDYHFSLYRRFRLYASILGYVVVVAVAYLLTTDMHVFWVVIIIGLSKVFENQSDLYYGALQKASNYRYMAFSLMLRGFCGLVALGLGYYFSHNMIIASLCYTASWAVICFGYDIKMAYVYAKDVIRKTTPSTHGITSLFYLGLPLGLSVGLINLNGNLPRLFIGQSFTLEELGVFASMVHLIMVGGLVSNSMGQAIAPKLAQYYSQQHYKRYMSVSLLALLISYGIGIVGVALTWLVGKWVLVLLFNESFVPYDGLFFKIALFAPFLYANNVFGYIISATRKNKRIFYCQLSLTLVLIVGLLVLPAHYGLDGVAYATTIGMVFANIVFIAIMVYELLILRHKAQK